MKKDIFKLTFYVFDIVITLIAIAVLIRFFFIK